MGNAKRSDLVWPDYKNCIANLPNSVLKKVGAQPAGDTLALADRYLEKDHKNIVILLLDGMGKSILERHLMPDGPFRSHLAGIYQSTFLSTTVAATTSAMSGLQPCEHSWLGWDCYYPSVDKNITVFLNTEQGTDVPAADYNVAWKVTPYEDIVQKIRKIGKQAYMVTPFAEPYPDGIEAICERIKDLCNQPGEKSIYAYWKQPDGLLHRKGCGSPEVHEALIQMQELVAKLAEEVEDTLIFVTADHGHLDTDAVVITDYPKIMDCLVRMPSLEPRVLNLFVKEEKKAIFEQEFNKEFGDKFLLMPMEEAIEKGLFGTGKPHKEFRAMLGNYLAIATGNLSIFFDEEPWVSMHGSVTPDEMLIPLIVFES